MLANDGNYGDAREELREAEATVARIEALLEGVRDARRADEWQIRARLADALMRAGVQSDGENGAEFDDATDYAAMRAFSGALNHLEEEESLPF